MPIDVWFEGLQAGEEVFFTGNCGKPHRFAILAIPEPDKKGVSDVRYIYDSERLSHQVQLAEAQAGIEDSLILADPDNEGHIASPSTGDLWVTHVSIGDVVKKGEEIFNISIMKQEKAVLAPKDGQVLRVLKTANFQQDKKMIPVQEGELIVEIGPLPQCCDACGEPIVVPNCKFCPSCGAKR